MALALHWVAVGWGISLGYHRLHTHQSYQCPRWLEYFFAVCGTMTLEGGPMFWVGTHRLHHAKSDQPGDPHSPREGAFWSHMGWIVFGETNHNNRIHGQVRAGSGSPQVLLAAEHVSLGPGRGYRSGAARFWRIAHVPVGILPAHRLRTALHLADQFRHAHLRQAPF